MTALTNCCNGRVIFPKAFGSVPERRVPHSGKLLIIRQLEILHCRLDLVNQMHYLCTSRIGGAGPLGDRSYELS